MRAPPAREEPGRGAPGGEGGAGGPGPGSAPRSCLGPTPAAAPGRQRAASGGEGEGGSRLPRASPLLPALGRGSLRLPDRLTGLPPASPRQARPPSGLPAVSLAGGRRSSRRFLPSASGFPSPQRLARMKPARRWASSPASPPRPMGPRRREAAPAPWRWRTEPTPRRAGGRAGARREVSLCGSWPGVRRCAICTSHVGVGAAPQGARLPRKARGECAARPSPVQSLSYPDLRA